MSHRFRRESSPTTLVCQSLTWTMSHIGFVYLSTTAIFCLPHTQNPRLYHWLLRIHPLHLNARQSRRLPVSSTFSVWGSPSRSQQVLRHQIQPFPTPCQGLYCGQLRTLPLRPGTSLALLRLISRPYPRHSPRNRVPEAESLSFVRA